MPLDSLQTVLEYHQQTKHHLNRYAQSLGYMDWATQPDPFRRYQGSPQFDLNHSSLAARPSYDSLFRASRTGALPLNLDTISRLFYESLAISAWKQAPGTSAWSLRINPSSGCLHPTESYLIVGEIEGLSDQAAVYHYAPYLHSLEQRLVLSPSDWSGIIGQIPAQGFLIALTSIYSRESWKYGERAFRYCHHDVGHAIGSLTFAAATLGWHVRLVETVSDADLKVLLGIHTQRGMEAEHPDCLLVVFADNQMDGTAFEDQGLHIPTSLLKTLESAEFAGTPNRLSHEHHEWPIVDDVSVSTRFDGSKAGGWPARPSAPIDPGEMLDFYLPDRDLSAAQIIRQRRSAVDMDGKTSIDRATFFHMMGRVFPDDLPITPGRDPQSRIQDPRSAGFPFAVLPWRPRVSLALFVHRVEDLTPGLYLLVRHPSHESRLRQNLNNRFIWRSPQGCPANLNLWMLFEADCQQTAKHVSCHQDIAADGVFSLGMLVDYEDSLQHEGPWFYPRLFWETGLIGQVLYLEAEAAGIRSTGIG